jgi:putative ABC transport system permease protein
MTGGTLARRSLAFYWRSHLGTIAGAAIATAVLTGALLVGDSVRGSLRAMALARLGKIDVALASGDRLFRAELAGEIQKKAAGSEVTALLQLPGTASNPEGTARANQIQVSGVSADFFQLANSPISAGIPPNSVWINEPLATHLKTKAGETILLRVPRVSHLSRDAPLAPDEDATVALRLEIGRVLTDEQFGRFGLAASQVPPFNAFLPLSFLQQQVKATNQANLLLAKASNIRDVSAALQNSFTLADAQLSLRQVPGKSETELRTARVFLDNPIVEAATKVPKAQPVFTYFVNRLLLADRTTPYSMVSAAPGVTPADLKDDEIVINQWLADDLQAKPGDHLTLAYFVMGLMRELVERTNTFRIRQIVPMQLPYADKTLMPDFPGMTDAENCRDWETGFPINTAAIRDMDEDYWHKFRGSPKAFVTLHAAQQMWSNRFGNLTAVRYPESTEQQQDAISAAILANLPPASLGMTFQPAREQALAASAGAQDFGGLFIGFSFFLVAAALLLMSLLFRFALELRGLEIGTLLAIGFAPKKVRRLLLLEGAGLAMIGGLIGVAGAVLYAKAMLYGLRTVWSDAVAGSALSYYGSGATLATGLATGIIVALITIWWGLRREGRRPARELLVEGFEEEYLPAESTGRKSRKSFFAGIAAAILALVTLAYGLAKPEEAGPDLFFSAGALVLIGGLFLTASFIRRLEKSSAATHLSLTGMGVRSITRRRKRSRAAVALLACGAFLITSIGAFRLDAGKNADSRASGTGGFALLAESSIPVVQNLNAKSGRDFYNLSAAEFANVHFVPFRVLSGEDASCLNLNRAQRPRLLGVNPQSLGERKSFTFSDIAKDLPRENPWLLLDRDFGPDVVPAIGDAASIQWALGKKLGDSIDYLDSNGKTVHVRLVAAVANSILQGSLIISENQFVKHFPTESGYRMFLIDAPSKQADELASTLSKSMQDVGLEVTSTKERLNTLNAVQNTYLGTFQMLGGLGLLLGTVGLGIILLRNVFERRSELALLVAVGFRKSALRWLVLSEHTGLLLLGLLIGVVAALVAVLPSLLAPGREVPLVQLGVTLGAVLLCGLLWTVIAAGRALHAPLLQALRNE